MIRFVRVLVVGVAVLIAGAVTNTSRAQQLNGFPEHHSGMVAKALGAVTVGSGWQSFLWNGTAPTPSLENPFTFTLPGPGYIAVVDAYNDGDQFAVYEGATLIANTSVPVDDGTNVGGNPDQAWANPKYSRGYFPLAAGAHSINITTIQNANCPGCTAGAAFLRVGLQGDGFNQAIPTLGLVGLAFLAVVIMVAGLVLLRRD